MMRGNPILMWPGGKRRLAERIVDHFPQEFGAYYEPFVGGGAVFFEAYRRGLLAGDKKIVLSDANENLIITYQQIKRHYKNVIDRLRVIVGLHGEAFFYHVRSQLSTADLNPVERAAMMIYYNRACYNGLYRVNKKGGLNTPWGKKKKIDIDYQNIEFASNIFRDLDVLFCYADYRSVVTQCQSHDLVYLDPPYYQSYTGYTAAGYTDDDHDDLAQVYATLDTDDVYVILSNRAHPRIQYIYATYRQTLINIRYTVGPRVTTPARELLICSWDADDQPT